MRRAFGVILIVVLALSALASAPRAFSAGSDVPPQIIDTIPVRGEELTVEGTVTFFFNQSMDRASTEAAFSTTPALRGAFEWLDPATLRFKPSQALERASTYSFTVRATARSAEGVAMRDDFTLKLNTVGFLEVTQIVPQDGTEQVEATPTITVIFNRPVVPLMTVAEMKKLPSPLTLEPAAEGVGEWLSTSIYTFKPAGLRGGTAYTITVKAGLTDVTGSVLKEAVVARFKTISPRAIEVLPSDGSDRQLLDRSINVIFSQPMNPEAVQQASTLINDTNNQPVAGTFEWNERRTRFTFKPATLLDYSTTYTLRIDPKVALSETGASLSESVVSSFSTIERPDVIQTWPRNGEKETRESGITFRFSAPMDLKDFKKRVTITPKPGLTFEDYADSDGFFYTVAFSHEPSTSYTVTLDITNFKDRYGTLMSPNPRSNVYRVVGGKLQIRWTTPDYPPEASLRTGYRVGLYSAYSAQTRVFSTHRNIDTINLALSSISLNDFLEIAAQPYRDTRAQQIKLLREWTVKVENPKNVLRYDLLTITDQGETAAPTVIECPGAPPSRLKVGDEILVLPDDPTPLRIRQQPGLDGRIVAEAPANTRLTIYDGPRCVNQFVWWYVDSGDNRYVGWAAEGSPQQYFVGREGMTSRVLPQQGSRRPGLQPYDPNAKPLKPGAYVLRFSSPNLNYGGPIRHIMFVATANVTFKVSERSALAWVTDLQSGQPLVGVPVSFLQRTEGSSQRSDAPGIINTLGQATTDKNGLATLQLPERLASLYTDLYAVVDDGTNLGLGFTDWDSGISPWEFDQIPNFYPQDVSVYLYTDRSLYRPGQPVYFRGVLRNRDDVTYTLSDFKTINVEVIDNNDQTIYQKDVPVSAFGSFSDQVDIAETAPLGYYRIIARPGFDAAVHDPRNWRGPVFSRGINVAQYRVPEFQVKVEADKSDLVQGEKITVNVESSFFFGGAVSNARVEWTAFSDDYFFRYRGAGNYNFVDFNEDEYFRETGRFGESVASGQGTTDAQGRFTIELPASLGKATQSQRYTIEARVIDESDQLIAGRAQVVVHQGEFYIGAGPQVYVGAATKPQKINLITVGWDSKPMPNTDLSVRVVERRWSSVQTVEPATGRTVWNYEVKEIPVTDGEVRTDADGKAVYEFTPPRGGIYKIYAASRDSRGNQITTSTFLWVAGPDYVPWRQQNSNRIDLKIDRDEYRVGDRASMLIASPFQGEAKALITIERGKVITTDVVTMPTNSFVYEFDITPDMAPNVFISVTVVKGVDGKNPIPGFRMGLIQIGVDAERLALNIKVTPDREQAGPRETVNYTIKVTDYQGEPVQAELGVGLTDLAVLSLLPDTSTPIMQWFYSQQSLGVRTANSLTISVDQQTQEILNTIKGGGGGGPEGGIFEVRQRFIDTPLWQPSVVTNAQGEAVVSVTLPDQLTTWRLDVRAVTKPLGELKTTLVGQETFDLISTKPLLIRPITPRFFVVGDQSTLVAVVNNNSGADQNVTARVEVKGARLLDLAEKTANISNLGRARFEWPIEVDNVNALDVTFFASAAGGRLTDAAKSAVGQGSDKTLPVLRYEAPETVGTGGTLDAGGSRVEGVALPRRYEVTEGTLQIRLDRSLAATTVDALEVLENFPYQCTEQTISRFLPNVATYGAFQKLGLEDAALRTQTEIAVSYAVQRLYRDQKVDGGWGWFRRDVSNPLVTAYALIGLIEARNAGFPVDDGVIEAAVRFLRQVLSREVLSARPSTWQLNRSSFLLYALARADAGNFSRAVALFDRRELMSIYGRAYLAMAFNLIDPRNTTYTSTLLSDLNNRAIVSATGVHWEESFTDWFNWNTDVRTSAIVLKALIQLDPQSELIPNAVRWLMVARKADAWETTQETAWSVMALVDWMQFTGELRPDYTFGASLNGTALAAGETATPQNVRDSVRLTVQVADLLKDQVNRLAIDRSDGAGILYYTAHLTVNLPVEQIEPLDRGMSISRAYTLVGDKTQTPITEAHVGDNIQVTLTIVAPRDLHYVVITDPIPAGTEAVNPELETSAIGEPPTLNLDDPFGRGWGWWWFSETELRDEKTVLYATYLPRGTYRYTYIIRAGLAGTYRVIPPTGQEFYFPEVYGRGAGSIFTLKPARAGAADPTESQPTPTPGQ